MYVHYTLSTVILVLVYLTIVVSRNDNYEYDLLHIYYVKTTNKLIYAFKYDKNDRAFRITVYGQKINSLRGFSQHKTKK